MRSDEELKSDIDSVNRCLNPLSLYSTANLVAELEKREGVALYDAPDCDHVYDVGVRKYGDEFWNGETHDGPAKILVVIE